MNTQTRWLTNSGCTAQALSTSNYQVSNGRPTAKLVAPGNPGTPGISEDSETHPPTVCQTTMKAMSLQLQSDLCAAAAKDKPQHRPLLPKLDILAVDPDEELQEEWEAEDDVKGGPLDLHEVKIARQKKRYSICGTVRCTSTPPKRNRGHERDDRESSPPLR